MAELFDIINEKKKEIRDKASYLSKKANRQIKFKYNLVKKRPKYLLKSSNDLKYIEQLVTQLQDGEQVHCMSNAFDSPSIIYAIEKLFGIKEIVCSTWAITDRGLAALNELSGNAKTYLLLDKTYSYKWVFESGAINDLQNVELKFTENHSKVILIETKDGRKYSFVGSMNLSNNPRLENIMITLNEDLHGFYRQIIIEEFN